MTAVAKINPRRYGKLLARVLPQAIETEEDNERALAVVEGLLDKGEARTPEEVAFTRLMVALIERFEAEHYPIPKASPHEILQALAEEHGLKQADLLDVFGSRGYASDVWNGKRSISVDKALALGERFGVSAELFLEPRRS
jgi:HTH-type transcriptional regulator / antitoxin HigA